MLATHHHSPSILPLPAQSIHPDMATDGTRVHFCVDSWTLHLQKMIKHSHQNHQIMKVLQARDPLDFVLHCSNRSLKHIEPLTLMHIFRSRQIFAAVSPLIITSFVPGGKIGTLLEPTGYTGYLISSCRIDRDSWNQANSPNNRQHICISF